ncbi:DUF302 domain-containing protein [uncultured Jannaschia sp.]|uniref:DUF302 domain-containing protein n=1 Tax=uncultured Jannaschia sp. TaxID=293347 RepID=UPI00261BB450|nr:DUF302 domain-containing protein [uncultured Jannaschia sp.]
MLRSTLAALAVTATAATAQEVAIEPYDGSVADAAFAVENAITGMGLRIVFTGNVGEMLEETGEQFGLGPSPVGPDAKTFMFCSMTAGRDAIVADPANLANCPLSIFVAEIDGGAVIGHRVYAEETMAPLNDLLDEIVTEATAW